ncbi:MAG TPA: alpha/beta hydrolase, partial [Acidimicrobiales bacterium]|nr:alpha/beta hydrolase [Acidimicrobiales bacterium]
GPRRGLWATLMAVNRSEPLTVAAWRALGTMHRLAGHEVFAVDLAPSGPEEAEPLVVVHGYPSSSFDFAAVAPRLAERRRVVLVDLLGYGLSDKPDLNYTMALQADVVVGLTAELGIDELSLLTHDMGDTVGGELLARHAEGSWPVQIARRVLTNGSIYIAMAQLTAGQLLLLSLPDEEIGEGLAPGADAVSAALAATLAPANAGTDMSGHASLVLHNGGNRMLARTIRYIEERRANERRFTGAIESHPSPLGVVWGPEDPIAVVAMVDHLREVRPDAEVRLIEGSGHYPQVEDPKAFADAVLELLD